MRESAMLENIPTYVLAGPLGAGKTSVARHWLKQRFAGERWAVLVNEFGDIGLDAALLGPQADGISITEVSGGCVCCVNGAPFTIALSRLIRSVRPNRLLIELSGLSHPLPLIQQLKAEPWAGVLALAPLVVVIDADAILNAVPLPEAIQAVLKHSGTIVINKADLIAPDQRSEVETALGDRGVWATNGEVDWESLPGNTSQQVATAPLIFNGSAKPLFSLGNRQTAQAGDWSIGWQLPPERLLDRHRIEALLQHWPWKRAKMIIRSPMGWHSANLLPQQPIEWQPSEWRKDSRVELIFDSPQPVAELEKAWETCELPVSGTGALVGLPPLA